MAHVRVYVLAIVCCDEERMEGSGNEFEQVNFPHRSAQKVRQIGTMDWQSRPEIVSLFKRTYICVRKHLSSGTKLSKLSSLRFAVAMDRGKVAKTASDGGKQARNNHQEDIVPKVFAAGFRKLECFAAA